MSTTQTTTPAITDQAGVLLGNAAGYVGHRTIGIGLRSGLIATLADAPGGLTADELATHTDHDPFYVGVWCRSALAAGLCERDGDDGSRLAPHVDTLLLDQDAPGYVGGLFPVLEQHEVSDRFESVLGTGERLRNDCSPEWIEGVAGSGRPFYTRLVPGGVAHVEGLAERLAAGGRIVDTAAPVGGSYGWPSTSRPVSWSASTVTPTRSRSRGGPSPVRGWPTESNWSRARWRSSCWTSRRRWSSTTSPCTSVGTSTG